MNRSTLDALVAHYRLDEAGTAEAFAAVKARPDPDELLRWTRLTAAIGGALSLGVGVTFFVAANWHAVPVLGRFALVQLLLIAAVVTALIKPPPSLLGRLAVFVAIILTGGLLALYGQTYQTGADVYELFFLWAALSLPLALAGRYSATWALWAIVLNLGLGLFCGFVPGRHVLWLLLSRWGLSQSLLVALPMLANLLFFALGEWQSQSGAAESGLGTRWLRRSFLVAALLYGTTSVLLVILEHRSDEHPGLSILLYLLACASILARTLQQRADVLPLAALCASGLVVMHAWLLRALRFENGALYVVTLVLIGSSALVGMLLMRAHRSWKIEEAGQ